ERHVVQKAACLLGVDPRRGGRRLGLCHCVSPFYCSTSILRMADNRGSPGLVTARGRSPDAFALGLAHARQILDALASPSAQLALASLTLGRSGMRSPRLRLSSPWPRSRSADLGCARLAFGSARPGLARARQIWDALASPSAQLALPSHHAQLVDGEAAAK